MPMNKKVQFFAWLVKIKSIRKKKCWRNCPASRGLKLFLLSHDNMNTSQSWRNCPASRGLKQKNLPLLSMLWVGGIAPLRGDWNFFSVGRSKILLRICWRNCPASRGLKPILGLSHHAWLVAGWRNCPASRGLKQYKWYRRQYTGSGWRNCPASRGLISL